MKRYSSKQKRTIQEKMLLLNISISSLAESEGISRNTLNRWLEDALFSIIKKYPQKIRKLEQALAYKEKTLSDKNIQGLLQVTMTINRDTET
ncbi:hypothetical protein [Xenorhabdus sp. PB62.4]|uniref:hypothetical protein n=1 Tax=Xenorhabdus sp. PB62.4 TaxID=1851573 RepID=UPI0016570D11|nr:hypothetical protein [Xenorhabdus sp. PB62.4]MBC8951447.1 transposase [Xenorhabdus sp. PB62.4]